MAHLPLYCIHLLSPHTKIQGFLYTNALASTPTAPGWQFKTEDTNSSSLISILCNQHSMLEHLQTSALIFIAESINIHPNPGPNALYILKDFTNPEQRELFITEKRLKLN